MYFETYPLSKYLTKFFINCSSLECWANWKTNSTITPFLHWEFLIKIMKLPSAEVKPAIQSGSGARRILPEGGSISVILSTSGLLTGTTVGKAAFKLSVRPLLRVALIATIFCNPCSVKCSSEALRRHQS